MKILALDLGKFKSVCCFFDTKTRKAEFLAAATDRHYLSTIFKKREVDKDDAFKLARMAAMNEFQAYQNEMRLHFQVIVGTSNSRLIKHPCQKPLYSLMLLGAFLAHRKLAPLEKYNMT